MVSYDAVKKLVGQVHKTAVWLLSFSVGRPGVGGQSGRTTGATRRLFADGQRTSGHANGAGLALVGIKSRWDRL